MRVGILLAVLFLGGCASMDPEVHKENYKQVARRDMAVNSAVSAANERMQAAWYNAVSTVAGREGNNATAALIALAMSKPENMKPVIQEISRPERGSDYTKMILGVTGVVGAVHAFGDLTSTLKNASGTVYNLTAGRDIAGSANQRNIEQNHVGGNAKAEKCEDCDTDKKKKDNLNDPEEMPDICPDTGSFRDGTWWVAPGSQCSCKSRAEGRC